MCRVLRLYEGLNEQKYISDLQSLAFELLIGLTNVSFLFLVPMPVSNRSKITQELPTTWITPGARIE